MQATDRRAPPVVFRSDGVGHQLCAGSGAGLGAEAYILREQGLAGPGDEVSVFRESSSGSGVLYQEAPPLFPEFYGISNDVPPHPEGIAKARYRWKDGSLGGGAIRV